MIFLKDGKVALRSRTPRYVLASPSSGADPDKLVECARERCLVIKSRLNRDVDQRQAGLAHQLFGVVNAMPNQPLVRGDTKRGFEGAGKMADRKSAFLCNLREPHVAMQVLVKKLGGSPLLPWRQAAV